jgi:hypothetical protein
LPAKQAIAASSSSNSSSNSGSVMGALWLGMPQLQMGVWETPCGRAVLCCWCMHWAAYLALFRMSRAQQALAWQQQQGPRQQLVQELVLVLLSWRGSRRHVVSAGAVKMGTCCTWMLWKQACWGFRHGAALVRQYF